MNDAPELTTYRIEAIFLTKEFQQRANPNAATLYLASEVEALLKETRAALTTFRTARTEAQFSRAMLQADSLLARLK